MNKEEINDCYARFAAGDGDAFEEIVTYFRDNLIYFINRYINNMDIAEDLSEDVFVELLMNPKRYKMSASKASLKTYIFTIGRNKAVDYIRKNKKLMPDEISKDIADGAASFEDEFCKEEIKKAMYRIMKTMNKDYSMVLYLLYFENMSYEEAGRVMKKSKKQIANLTTRAKQTLRTALEKEGFEYEE
ncbi:MAG: RNA polymerase sigma factor [Lachnospiraceae bacterium]|nr:RNA polymerase sigma factor [Lachnospiraceae bacterium]